MLKHAQVYAGKGKHPVTVDVNEIRNAQLIAGVNPRLRHHSDHDEQRQHHQPAPQYHHQQPPHQRPPMHEPMEEEGEADFNDGDASDPEADEDGRGQGESAANEASEDGQAYAWGGKRDSQDPDNNAGQDVGGSGFTGMDGHAGSTAENTPDLPSAEIEMLPSSQKALLQGLDPQVSQSRFQANALLSPASAPPLCLSLPVCPALRHLLFMPGDSCSLRLGVL